MDTTLRSGLLTAEVSAHGAELVSLVDAELGELLWQAGPAWPRHAPVLFPIVGRLPEDTLLVDGSPFPMTQHGFARDREFTLVESGPVHARFRLTDDAQTRKHFPFGFVLEIDYAVEGAALRVSYAVANPGDRELPVSLGCHPAFAWPLPGGAAKEAHLLVFDRPEPAPVHRLDGGLLRSEPEPTPVRGDRLALRETLFTDDAVVMTEVASRSVRYGAPGSRVALEVAWDGFAQLGLWSKPGADFLCIEPWHGYASPVGSTGQLADKPGLIRLAPGDRRVLTLTVTVRRVVEAT